VIDLERDVLDSHQGEHVELNNRVTFGRLLDMWPYTNVGVGASSSLSESSPEHTLNRVDCQYELTGVSCHKGDIGIDEYYYAIIKGRDGVWCKYTDSIVDPFDPDDENRGLESQCFGGSRTSKELQRTGIVDMLIYRKCTSMPSLPPSCMNTTKGWEVKHDGVEVPIDLLNRNPKYCIDTNVSN
jgi:hypothetical protein